MFLTKIPLRAKEMSMRRSFAGLLALVAVVLTVVVTAQDLTGTWQGVLQAGGREFRNVIKITKDGNALRAVLYSIDQSGQGVAGTAVVEGTTVRMSFPGPNISYEGRLGADGNSLTGTASQGAGKNPLNLARVSDDAAWPIPAPPVALKPMPGDADPGFEVATVKPTAPGTQGRLYTFRGRQLTTLNTTASNLITFAYGVHTRQILNGPEWIEKDAYDVAGTPDVEGAPNQQQMRTMIRKLLADRFKLQLHRDKKELPAYAITVARSGPKLTRSAADPNGPPSLIFRGPGMLPARNASMAEFAAVMQSAAMDRPVVDRTGLAGKYDFNLTWTPDDSQFRSLGPRPPAPENPSVPGLFTAIEEQLGLRMESTRAAVEVLVIDRIEKPTPD